MAPAVPLSGHQLIMIECYYGWHHHKPYSVDIFCKILL
jgi:hypothetical protein